MRSIIACTIVLLWTCTCSASDPVQTLTHCDNLSGWPNNVQLSTDAQEGHFAIVASPPAGQTGFFTYDFFSTGQDISKKHSLSFWWKVEGNGLRDLKIKVRNYPLAGGWEAVYTIWEGQTPPQGWQLAVVELAKPYDNWGTQPDYNRRYITFRTKTSQNSNVRLFIDHITTVDQTFSWQVDAPVQNSIAHLDFDGNGAVGFTDFLLFAQKFGATQTDSGYDPVYDLDSDGQIGFGDFLTFVAGFGSDGMQWYIPITFENPTTQPLNIVVGTETQTLLTQTIEAGTTRIRVPVPRDIIASRDPSIYPIPIWAQVADFIQTRSSWISYVPQNSKLVYPGPDGRLVYMPDEKGNIIPDFSHCGYMGGGVALPDVPVVLTVRPQPEGDDTARLQAAIDEVSARALDASGFRGTLLLKRGKYRIGGTLQIRASGVVLRGEGEGEDGTVLIATGTEQRTLIVFEGRAPRRPREVGGTRQAIVDDYVPVGTRTFAIADASGFAVGDDIIVHRPSTAQWIAAIGMDRIEMSRPDVRQWEPGAYDFRFDRTITAIEGNRITIDAPMGNAFEREYGGGWIYKYEYPGRIEQVGIENLRGVSEFDDSEKDERREGEFVDEDHAWNFVVFSRVQNAWARNVTSVYFGYTCVTIGKQAKWMTVQDSQCLDPVSQITGSRRYSFAIHGQLSLVQRCYTRRGRHDYVLHDRVPGPNVFLDCTADIAYSDSGPHHRWSVCTLFDNVIVNGNAINVQDRQGSGAGHGWAGAQKVFWNCEAESFIVQKPPTSQNYAIGCIGEKREGWYKREDGYWESHGQKVHPRSLYLKQLEDRLGIEAVKAVATRAQIGKGD